MQTSTAISAGLEQWKGRAETEAENGHVHGLGHGHVKNHALHSGSPHIRAMDHWDSAHLSAIPEPEETPGKRRPPTATGAEKDNVSQSLLRLDAFLGEWLSPDYFDNITPPPGSKMMVAGAKADLLRRGDPIDGVRQPKELDMNQGSFPGGWKSDRLDERKKSLNNALNDGTELSQAPLKIGRANSYSIASSAKRPSPQFAGSLDRGQSAGNTGYTPPIPPYAISPSQPIPQGYVAHARDACVRVDYQWDSMRPPLGWGNGGEYGEEWSAMHRRFRRGLHEMILWYRNHEAFQEADGKSDGMEELSHSKTVTPESVEDEENDTVLILVTHGAGCNALIGALTSQPVLIDVGMASLTMAVRKSVDYRRIQPETLSRSQTQRPRRSSIDSGASEEYDVKLTASTDHLRPGSQYLGLPPPRMRSPSLPVREKSPYRYERHVGPITPHVTSSPVRDSFATKPPRQTEGSFSETPILGIHRAATTAGSSTGLWSPLAHRPKRISTPDGAQKTQPRGDQPLPQSENSHVEPLRPVNDTPVQTNRKDSGGGKTLAHQGLWTAEPRALGTERDQTTPKRRWTLGQA